MFCRKPPNGRVRRIFRFAFSSRIKQFDDVYDVLRSLRNGTTQDVYLTGKQIVDYDNLIHFRAAKILYTKETIQLLPFSIFFQRDSCLLQTFNWQLSALAESGLMQAWIARFTRTVYMHEDSEPQQIRVDHFLGTFEICAFMLAASLLLFLLELLSVYVGSIKNAIDFCVYSTQNNDKTM